MKLKIGTLAVLVTLFVCAAAQAAPVTVNVRIEGATRTIFQGRVTTEPETLTKDASGPHACNGENGGANKTPGATATTALDAATRKAGVAWTATWNQSYGDFFIDSIGSDTGSATRFWTVAVNYQDLLTGACQDELKNGDQVLWYFGPGAKDLLVLRAPTHARARRGVRVKVIDGRTGKPVAGATVDGHRSNLEGVVTVRFARAGHHVLTATLAGSERSNAVKVAVRKR